MGPASGPSRYCETTAGRRGLSIWGTQRPPLPAVPVSFQLLTARTEEIAWNVLALVIGGRPVGTVRAKVPHKVLALRLRKSGHHHRPPRAWFAHGSPELD